VDVRTSPKLVVGTPRMLFRKRTFTTEFDVTDDGQFLMVEAANPPQETPFTVTVNWRPILGGGPR
jgi:hypothetical protein